MTRDEALYKVKGYLTDIIPAENYSEVEEIIKALEQEPCEDCISRQDAIDAFKKATDDTGILDSEDVKMILSNLPSAEPKTGEWVEEDEYGDLWVCDQCGFASEYKDNFCRNCGAKMTKSGEDE